MTHPRSAYLGDPPDELEARNRQSRDFPVYWTSCGSPGSWTVSLFVPTIWDCAVGQKPHSEKPTSQDLAMNRRGHSQFLEIGGFFRRSNGRESSSSPGACSKPE
jgi:hypothetical protein